MELKTYFAQDASGNIMPGAAVTVYLANTLTLATGLEDENGSPLSNPFTADSSAKVAFYAPDGLYDITVVGNGRTVTIRAQFVSVDGASVLRADLAAPGGSALVGFQQSGTGAVARTAQDKLREVERTPQDYGAVATGLVDDSAAIQKAINAVAANGGGTVKFPAGAYKIDAGVTLASNVKLIGEPGAVIKPSDLVPLWAFRGAGANNVKVIGLTFEGTGTAFTDGNQRLLQFESASSIEISGCTFTKAREGGVSINACSDVIVSNSHFIRNYGTGLTTRDGCSRVTVDSCVFHLNGDTGAATSAGGRGLLFWRTANSVASNCVFESNTEYGMRLYSQAGDADANRNIAISSCVFRDNGTVSSGKSDLYIYNDHGGTEIVTVTGCAFLTRDGNSGAVMSGTNMAISGCSFKAITPRSNNHAVSLFGATNVACVGNAITDFTSAFNMSGTVGFVTTKCVIAENAIDGVTAFSGATILGQGNIISGNRIKKGGAGASDVCFALTTNNVSCRIERNTVEDFYRGFNIASSGGSIEIKDNTTAGSTGTGFFAEFNTDLSKQAIAGNSFESAYPNVFGQFTKPSTHAFSRAAFYTNVIPSSGGVGGGANVQWKQGDRAVNNTTAVGSPKGWVCTVAGAPGTWVSEGNL